MKSYSFLSALGAAMLACVAFAREYIIEPMAHAIDQAAAAVTRFVDSLFQPDDLVFDFGDNAGMPLFGGHEIDAALQREIEHDRSHALRAAGRNI